MSFRSPDCCSSRRRLRSEANDLEARSGRTLENVDQQEAVGKERAARGQQISQKGAQTRQVGDLQRNNPN